ncbi:MAG: CarD family transcriptional regulator [Paracoccaceae bacterium]|nr:CarD family transcriptional regulator [Paracoccaceae bacterium]MDE2915407.1 CarD family transcriptional regulator [Paracoccaceae bacterium]
MAPARRRLPFKTNQFVVYPAHGVGKIKDVETLDLYGSETEVFVIYFEKDKMTLQVPVAKAQSNGMRQLSSEDQITNALKILKGKPRIKRAMWSRRAQEYDQKINSGDLIAITEVVRDLHRNDEQREQSYSERQLYEAALGRLSREVAIVEGLEETAALGKIDTILSSRAT